MSDVLLQPIWIDDIITGEIRGDIDESYWEMSSVGGKTYI